MELQGKQEIEQIKKSNAIDISNLLFDKQVGDFLAQVILTPEKKERKPGVLIDLEKFRNTLSQEID